MSIDSDATTRPLNDIRILSEVNGIFNGDILIRHALINGLKDLRENPWQLQLVFASLLDDTLTSAAYGQKEIDKAVNWFLKTEVPIIWDVQLQQSPNMPCITIGLQEGSEAEATLADTHYVTNESTKAEWEPITSKFNAQYDPETGIVIPSIEVIANTQMLFVDGVGNSYPILGTKILNNEDVFLIATGLNTNFSNCYLKWSTNKLSVNLCSRNFKDTFTVGCHTAGDPIVVIYLFNIVLYCLLRYTKTLLEARGFERSQISYTKVLPNTSLAPVGSENVWSRFITISGFVKNYWAQETSERINSAGFDDPAVDGLKFSPIDRIVTTFKGPPDQEDPSWMASDGIGLSVDEIE
jgi:hypothetical protein